MIPILTTGLASRASSHGRCIIVGRPHAHTGNAANHPATPSLIVKSASAPAAQLGFSLHKHLMLSRQRPHLRGAEAVRADRHSRASSTNSDNLGHERHRTAQAGDTDLGYQTLLNGTLVSNIVIDTTEVATDTIDYVVTDQSGLTATSTRTVLVEAVTAATSTP
jgi:hypothetical protein